MPDFVASEDGFVVTQDSFDGVRRTLAVPASPRRLSVSSAVSSQHSDIGQLEDAFEDSYLTSLSRERTMPSSDERSVNTRLSEIEIISRDETASIQYSNQIPPPSRDRMRRRLRKFFMNPIQKWKLYGRFPWKLCMQVIKIVFVTVQLSFFGMNSYKYAKQHQDTLITLSHIFLEDWDSLADIVSYPPSSGPYAVYTKPEFYGSIDHVIKKYTNIVNIATGSYGYNTRNGSMSPIHFCKRYFRDGTVIPYNETIIFDNTPRDFCMEIPQLYPPGDSEWNNFSIETFLQQKNRSISFHKLISVRVSFMLKIVYLKSLSRLDKPDCYKVNITVLYDNSDHDGQIMVSLTSKSEKLKCHVNVDFSDDNDSFDYDFRQVLNYTVIILCGLSLILCSRSLYKGQVLRRQSVQFFKKQYGKSLSFNDQLDFVDFWYVMIIINDVLIILGSSVKIRIEKQTIDNDQYTTCSLLLGLGNLLVWIGVLRYLGFFHKYNILILTLKKSLPNVLRFMLCALLLYCGFCFCGWVVLGPYHIKFRSFSSTSECLFSLMNGDDMFATFAIMQNYSPLIWWFSRAYLYLFISLFIYVVISLFISMIMDTYETIKNMYTHGVPPKTPVDIFLMECHDEEISSSHQDKEYYKGPPKMSSLFDCCCGSKRNGYERI